jgi:hypothetical protein
MKTPSAISPFKHPLNSLKKAKEKEKKSKVISVLLNEEVLFKH